MRPPLALYVHIPWCVRKCPYCDFNSHAAGGDLPEAAYVQALLADLEAEQAFVRDRPLQSIFIGGGTPSLFSGAAIQALLDGVRTRLPLSADCEITLEANPGTAEAARFADYRAAGVNRLSIGVQSFDSATLRALGRIHDGDQARQAIALAREAGFVRINADLMHGLPGQDAAAAVADLDAALAAGVDHLSWYQLTIEPNTAFFSAPPVLPAEGALLAIQEAGEARLQAAGLCQYEVSAWAVPGQASRHNLNYWTFGDYLGIGAGAHGKVSLADGRLLRRWKTRVPADYLNRACSPLAGASALDADDRRVEFFMNALRLREGVPAALFPARTGLNADSVAGMLDDLRRRGLLQADTDRIACTALGYRYLDTVLQAFL